RRHPDRCLAPVREAIKGDSLPVDLRQRLEPRENLPVLMKDEREQRSLEEIRLAAEQAVLVFPAIRIVGREDDEAALGELRGEVVIGPGISFHRVLRQAVPTVLTNDDGTLLAGLQIFRKEQDSPREEFRSDVQHDVISDPLLLVVDLARPGIGGRERILDKEKWVGYDVVLDVAPEFFAWGILLLP